MSIQYHTKLRTTYSIDLVCFRACHAEGTERLDETRWCIKDPGDLLVRAAGEAQPGKPRRVGHVVPVYLRSGDFRPYRRSGLLPAGTCDGRRTARSMYPRRLVGPVKLYVRRDADGARSTRGHEGMTAIRRTPQRGGNPLSDPIPHSAPLQNDRSTPPLAARLHRRRHHGPSAPIPHSNRMPVPSFPLCPRSPRRRPARVRRARRSGEREPRCRRWMWNARKATRRSVSCPTRWRVRGEERPSRKRKRMRTSGDW
jgi:hypothetical protein